MAQSFFIWKGIDCRSKGIVMRGPAPIIRAEERVKHVAIPGRSGELTETEGENIYNSYIQTISISVRGGFRVRQVYDWLRGSGYVTFSSEPDKKQKARVIGAVTLSKHSRNLDYWEGEVQFYCEPLKEKLAEDKVTISSSGATVRNDGDVISRPLWKVTASGATVVITAGGKTLTSTEYSSGMVFYIDSDAGTVYNSDASANWTKWSSGEFPVLNPGNNTVNGSGWSSIEITKRERYL